MAYSADVCGCCIQALICIWKVAFVHSLVLSKPSGLSVVQAVKIYCFLSEDEGVTRFDNGSGGVDNCGEKPIRLDDDEKEQIKGMVDGVSVLRLQIMSLPLG